MIEMPMPETENLLKASPQDLAREVIKLRQYVALLVMRMRDFMEHKELSDSAASHLDAIETRQQRADCLLGRLDEMTKTLERQQRLLTSQIENLQKEMGK